MADNDQVGAGQSVNRSEEQAPKKELKAENAKLERRRKFLIGGLSTAPVIATLSSRPAWAGANCVVSDRFSDHFSEDTVTCQGETVTNWQNNTGQLSAIFTVGPENPITGHPDYSVLTDDELKQAKKDKILTQQEIKAYQNELATRPGTTFRQNFGISPPLPDEPDATMMQCLMGGALGGECVAAYCNAHLYGADFGYQPSAIVTMVRTGLQTDPDELNSTLWYLNHNLQGAHPWGNPWEV